MIKSFYLLFAFIFIFSCCTKKEEEVLKGPKDKTSGEIRMPDDSIHRNLGTGKGDNKAEELIKAADEADSVFSKSKADGDKKICIEKHMAAANYLMFEANLSPKKKYPPALRRYRRVLELDPSNKEAAENKKEIEDIYKSMGMQIPE